MSSSVEKELKHLGEGSEVKPSMKATVHFPGSTWCKGRINSHKLSSDLYNSYTLTHTHTDIHTHTHMHTCVHTHACTDDREK